MYRNMDGLDGWMSVWSLVVGCYGYIEAVFERKIVCTNYNVNVMAW